MLAASLRDPRDSDWPGLLALANRSVAHVPGAGTQEEWVENRRRLRRQDDDVRGFVLEEAGEIRGYVGIEPTPARRPGSWRVFLVCVCEDWSTVGAKLHDAATELLTNASASEAWLREYAEDVPYADFLATRGFRETQRFALPDGTEAIELTKPLA